MRQLFFLIGLFSLTIFSTAYAQNSSSSSSPAAQHDSSPTFGGLGQSRTKNTVQEETENINRDKESKNKDEDENRKVKKPTKSSPGGPMND